MTTEGCPCKQCPVVPICRHKKYLRVFSQCSLLRAYEPGYPSADVRNDFKIQAVEDALNPTKWHLNKPPGEKHRLIMLKTDRGDKTSYIYGGPRE